MYDKGPERPGPRRFRRMPVDNVLQLIASTLVQRCGLRIVGPEHHGYNGIEKIELGAGLVHSDPEIPVHCVVQVFIHSAHSLTRRTPEEAGWLGNDAGLQQARPGRFDIEVVTGHRAGLINDAAVAVNHVQPRRISQSRADPVQGARHEDVIRIEPSEPVARNIVPTLYDRIRLPAIGAVPAIGQPAIIFLRQGAHARIA